MARLNEEAVIGDKRYEYVVDHIMEEPNNGLIRVRVVERRLGISCYSFVIPADVWDAAVRGAKPFPTDEELKKLKDACEGTHWEMCDLREDSENYIKALEARVRELTADLEG
jgi:hypothetical protein